VGGEGKIPFKANTGFKALCEPSRWKVKDLLTGFTKGLSFHDFRHTAITNMGKVEMDISIIMAFSGHKTMAMFKRYINR
jgi:integrase